MPRRKSPVIPGDPLKLATAVLTLRDLEQEVRARGRIYRVLITYLVVLVVYSIFLIVAVTLTAAQIWHIPWDVMKWLLGSGGGLGASGLFFRAPLKRLFSGQSLSTK